MTGAIPVRVMVEDAWDHVVLELPEGTTLGAVKQAALEHTHVKRNPAEYMLKFRGAELPDEGRSLAEAGVVPHGELIVLSRRRRPVR